MALRDSHVGNVRLVSAVEVSTRKAGRKEKERLYTRGPAGELAVLSARASKRLKRWIAKAKSYDFPTDLKIIESLEKATSALDAAVAGLSHVPASWKPARGSIGGTPIAEGAYVTVKRDYRAARVELSDPSVKLFVTKVVVGGKAVCRVERGKDRGMIIAVPCRHLETV